MQQWWQREIVAATWSINKEKRIQQQKNKDREYCTAHVISIVSDGPDLSVWNMAGVDFVPLIWGSGSMIATSVYVSVYLYIV